MTRAKDRLILTDCDRRNGRALLGTSFLDEMGVFASEHPQKEVADSFERNPSFEESW
jgi:hypothetical protein